MSGQKGKGKRKSKSKNNAGPLAKRTEPFGDIPVADVLAQANSSQTIGNVPIAPDALRTDVDQDLGASRHSDEQHIDGAPGLSGPIAVEIKNPLYAGVVATEATNSSPMDVDEPEKNGLDGDVRMGEQSSSLGGDATTISSTELNTPVSNVAALQNVATTNMPLPSADLVDHIPGMYRILDLVSEQGSGGLVDKIIIAQESFGSFINDMCPGAYQSMTHVDFNALDELNLTPVGIYGSKSEIVRYIMDMNLITGDLARLLFDSKDEPTDVSQKILRSGLYIIRGVAEALVYVVYWPEDTTWNDDAISSVIRNRVTFMRYLTKIADQILALISDEHADGIVWEDDTTDDLTDTDDESDRLFTFEVAKTHEQEENVVTKPGFQVRDAKIEESSAPPGGDVSPECLATRLVYGDTFSGIMNLSYEPAHSVVSELNRLFSGFHLRQMIKQESFQLHPSLSEDSLKILVNHGLKDAAGESFGKLTERRAVAKVALDTEDAESTKELANGIRSRHEMLLNALQRELVEVVVGTFDSLSTDRLYAPSEGSKLIDHDKASAMLADLKVMFPQFAESLAQTRSDAKLKTIETKKFKKCKSKILECEARLEQMPSDASVEEQRTLVESVMQDNAQKDLAKEPKGMLTRVTDRVTDTFFNKPISLFSSAADDRSPAHANIPSVSTPAFLKRLHNIADKFPVLAEAANEAVSLVIDHFSSHIKKTIHLEASKVEDLQREECKKQLKMKRDHAWTTVVNDSRQDFLQAVSSAFLRTSGRLTVIRDVKEERSAWGAAGQLRVVGEAQSQSAACIKHSIRMLNLTEPDKQAVQLNASHVPQPKISNTAYTFNLPLNRRLVHFQLLAPNKCLLVTADADETLFVFLANLLDIEAAVMQQPKKLLHAEKTGGRSLVAFDENKRMLAICTVEKPTIHMFVFDETFGTLSGYGSSVDLRLWFEAQTSIRHITFRCGSAEELLIVDEGRRARVFSLVTQSFRPAFVQLEFMPVAMVSSPDGSCVFAVERHPDRVILQAYHWATFGSTVGICLEYPDFTFDSWAVTSFLSRTSSRCHFITLHTATKSLASSVLEITHKSTEFTFQANKRAKASGSPSGSTTHAAIIECHREVWTRFPVIPAVRRHTFKASTRQSRALGFVSRLAPDIFDRIYRQMVEKFEHTARKPIGSELASLEIGGCTYEELLRTGTQNVSRFKAGEWLVDLLCLIPIHLAVARDNRFVPLKDGMWSFDLERSLLGATVDQVIDKISFGWYESIFQSYMSSKPVKVVSSMGEQSVGKSFALNHLVDTSFAGSAMRTTEGVWMAVTPTDDALIVALDFEGVHSIERTAQEDSFLVLFNTAISNLVLFRNNFALSRDITGLFQSFQSSSTVLDPSANPSLFKSTLVIIVKDVVDSDKNEIMKEFSLKFQQIVQTEQDANFISRLHAGKLGIIPWPVIESRQFYTLFPTVKKMLDKQVITHPRAGIFLHTMKTLMAKLKTNDWGSIDQNLASHRAQQLRNLLPMAITTGAMEIEPVYEPLKDLDSGAAIAMPDSEARLFVAQSNGIDTDGERKNFLSALRSSWPKYNTRFDTPEALDTTWADELDQHLESQADLRLEHVRAWIDVNVARFTADASNFAELQREFQNSAITVKMNIRLCKIQCGNCQLLCLHPRHHEGPHDCQTSHKCPQVCSFVTDHDNGALICGMPAGHPGTHICDVSAHLCGQLCRLSGKGGCLERCAKTVDHADDEHICQARAHECGMPCSLTGVRLPDGSLYSCEESCCTSSEDAHVKHYCKQRSCPLKCQLCERLCASSDHLHALAPGSVHLCGSEHVCPAMCQSDGVCKIETTPHSINATFTGRHETFQYTKSTQESKRLRCAVAISPGHTGHAGKHSHDIGRNVFHYCKEQCERCGYFCTLPLGHLQPEHETSHGSMSKTSWSVEGPDGTALEVDGRKFASNDNGAPMLCSMVCRSLGRHAHIDYCRSASPAACTGTDLVHISTRMTPNPAKPKDWISHDLYWRRSGFRDPYSQDDRTVFSKCDALCAGPEHQADANGPAQPSHCSLPIFHAPHVVGNGPPGGVGYISGDGHHFLCRNPAQLQQAFHVIFVIDRSGSMSGRDRQPLANTPVTGKLRAHHNNRVGAVYSSLHAFWHARHTALSATANRRDAYSVILFDNHLHTAVNNDFASTPDALLDMVMPHGAGGGTNFDMALKEAQRCMQNHWSTERAPVIIFLSDGECNVTDGVVRDLCRQAVSLGKPLSFHAVAFGPNNQYLRRMNQIATEVQQTVPADPMHPVVACSYTEALDSIRLAETFLGIADSLTKPRGALMRA